MFGGHLGGGFGSELDVGAEAGQVLVAAFGLQFGRGAAGLGQVGEGGVLPYPGRPRCPSGFALDGSDLFLLGDFLLHGPGRPVVSLVCDDFGR